MKVIINVHGGVVQEVYADDRAAEVVLVDWDTEGCEPDDDRSLFTIQAAGGAIAHATIYPTSSMDQMPADMIEAVQKASK